MVIKRKKRTKILMTLIGRFLVYFLEMTYIYK